MNGKSAHETASLLYGTKDPCRGTSKMTQNCPAGWKQCILQVRQHLQNNLQVIWERITKIAYPSQTPLIEHSKLTFLNI